MPNPRRGGRLVASGVSASAPAPGGLASRFRGAERLVVPFAGVAFFASRSRGFFGAGISSWLPFSATPSLHEPAPALAVARVLDGYPSPGQFVAEPVGGRPVARCARRDALVEHPRELGLEIV